MNGCQLISRLKMENDDLYYLFEHKHHFYEKSNTPVENSKLQPFISRWFAFQDCECLYLVVVRLHVLREIGLDISALLCLLNDHCVKLTTSFIVLISFAMCF